ncbi:MAG: trans-2-enoyl-CoA reductase family protein [Spirochaetaceae bacterium]|nr:trans-2-enoyl-CoA reductase family protein [Spirochaetaceae bacterium]
MIVTPKIMANISLTAHPLGVAHEVTQQIDYIKNQPKLKGPKNALILGCSGGYGLATRIALAYSSGTVTLGASFEREPTDKKIGSVGYYANKAFSAACKADGLSEQTLNCDAFTNEAKEAVITAANQLFKGEKIDLIVYSLASPIRTDPATGITYKSVLKPIGPVYTGKTVDIFTGEVKDVEVVPANQEEIEATTKVMGGEDWQLWLEALNKANLLADNVITVAYSYIGPAITYPIYREGTIGRAKDHLEQSAKAITASLSALNGHAYVSVNKALVTRASSVIPVVPLYLALLFKIMKEKGLHEGCIEQEYRMIDKLYNQPLQLDNEGRLRLDDYEMREDVQAEIDKLWPTITTENLKILGDLEEVRLNFMQLHGFEVPGIDYTQDVDIS